MLSLTVWGWRRRKAVGGKGSLTELINQLMSDEAVCRTAPATPGLLISIRLFYLLSKAFIYLSEYYSDNVWLLGLIRLGVSSVKRLFNKPREWLVLVGFGWFWLVFDQYDQ